MYKQSEACERFIINSMDYYASREKTKDHIDEEVQHYNNLPVDIANDNDYIYSEDDIVSVGSNDSDLCVELLVYFKKLIGTHHPRFIGTPTT